MNLGVDVGFDGEDADEKDVEIVSSSPMKGSDSYARLMRQNKRRRLVDTDEAERVKEKQLQAKMGGELAFVAFEAKLTCLRRGKKR